MTNLTSNKISTIYTVNCNSEHVRLHVLSTDSCYMPEIIMYVHQAIEQMAALLVPYLLAALNFDQMVTQYFYDTASTTFLKVGLYLGSRRHPF